MTKRPDMQVVGVKIAQLRREKGLCAAAFARELEQPYWLVMLLESAHMEQSKRLIDLLPDSVIEDFLRDICAVYEVSYRWLTAWDPSTKLPPNDDKALEPVFLPVFMSPEDAVTFMDSLMELCITVPQYTLDDPCCIRQDIYTITHLFNLQTAQLRAHGHPDLAKRQRQQFRQLLREHIVQFEKRLGITESMVNSTEAI